MKKPLILLALFVLLSTVSFGQKCKFEKDETDDFTKERVRTAKFHIGGTFLFHWWMLLGQKGSNYDLTLQVSSTGKVDDIFAKGTKMLFKLENGKIIEIIADADYVPAFHVEGNVIVTNWLPKGPVSEENMKLLAESPITAIRVHVANQDVNSPNITNKEASGIQATANCLLAKD